VGQTGQSGLEEIALEQDLPFAPEQLVAEAYERAALEILLGEGELSLRQEEEAGLLRDEALLVPFAFAVVQEELLEPSFPVAVVVEELLEPS